VGWVHTRLTEKLGWSEVEEADLTLAMVCVSNFVAQRILVEKLSLSDFLISS